MTMSLGLIDDRTNPRVIEAMKLVVESCKKHGKIPGILTVSTQETKTAIDLGFKFIGLSSDMRFVASGAKEFLKVVGRA